MENKPYNTLLMVDLWLLWVKCFCEGIYVYIHVCILKNLVGQTFYWHNMLPHWVLGSTFSDKNFLALIEIVFWYFYHQIFMAISFCEGVLASSTFRSFLHFKTFPKTNQKNCYFNTVLIKSSAIALPSAADIFESCSVLLKLSVCLSNNVPKEHAYIP